MAEIPRRCREKPPAGLEPRPIRSTVCTAPIPWRRRYVSDADGDEITKYQFLDSTGDSKSGHWMVNGVAQTDSGRPRQLRTIIRQERKISRALIFSTNKTKGQCGPWRLRRTSGSGKSPQPSARSSSSIRLPNSRRGASWGDWPAPHNRRSMERSRRWCNASRRNARVRVSFVETKFPSQAECCSMTGAVGPGGSAHPIAHPQR